MAQRLPARPDLGQLRRQAKELRQAFCRGEPAAVERVSAQVGVAGPGALSLAVAQVVLAREYGYPGWPALKAAVDAMRRYAGAQLEAFLRVSLSDLAAARRLRSVEPDIALEPLAAVVLGDAARVGQVIARDPGWVSRPDEARGWAPLLYACYSLWPGAGPARMAGSVATVRLLLDAGASPDSHNGRLPSRGYRSALHGSVHANNVAVCRLLLERGADPNDRASLGAAAETGALDCLSALLAHAAVVDERSWTVEAAAWAGQAGAVRVLLEAVRRDRGAQAAAQLATRALAEGVGRRCLHSTAALGMVRTVLDFGADPDPTGEAPAIRTAARAGRPEVVELLRAAGARTPVTALDALIGACSIGDTRQVKGLLAADPGLAAQLIADEQATFVDLAADAGAEPVRLMLQVVGVPVTARNQLGETALHQAAYEGRPDTVRLLLAHDADLDARDGRFSATPLAYATVGSGERPNHDGDWVGVVRLLLDAGASRTSVWLSGNKAPSEQVAAVLQAHGLAPEATETAPARLTGGASPAAVPADEQEVLAEVTDQLRSAYAEADLELFSSLLHPQVRFGAGPLACHGRADVLARYRQSMLRLGVRGEIIHTETAPHTLIVSTRFAGHATGGRDPEPQTAHQRFTIINGLITAITGHPDLSTARQAAAQHAGNEQ